MSESLAITVDNLPVLLIQTIRNATWVTANSADLRVLARIVGRAQHAGIPCDDLLVVLASAAHTDLVPPNFDWSTEMKVLSDLTWSMISSSNGRRDTLSKQYGYYPTVADAISVAQRFVEDEKAKRAMEPGVANALIDAEMKRVSALFPQLGMSYGYIGNMYTGPRRDDRSWRVFTKLNDRHGYSVSFGDCHYDNLGELAFSVKASLERWAGEQVALLQAGKHYARCAAIAA